MNPCRPHPTYTPRPFPSTYMIWTALGVEAPLSSSGPLKCNLVAFLSACCYYVLRARGWVASRSSCEPLLVKPPPNPFLTDSWECLDSFAAVRNDGCRCLLARTSTNIFVVAKPAPACLRAPGS